MSIPPLAYVSKTLCRYIIGAGLVLGTVLIHVPAVEAQENGGTAARSRDSAVQPGDVIRLRIWMEPDLSGEFPIDADGSVVLPRIGPVMVRTESVESLRSRLTQAYGAFLNHTSIDVSVLRRVQVLGAVRNPGLYHVESSMNLSDALALAGGATPQGRNRIHLIRNGSVVAENLSPFTLVGSSPLRSGDQIVVPEKSWILRNPGIMIGTVSTVISLTIALLR